jgi:hypothetical protein
MDEIIKKVRPLYSELRGYLAVAPDPDKKSRIFDANTWNQLNQTIDELNVATSEDYSKFKVQPFHEPTSRDGASRTVIRTQDYCDKLSGLINRLQGKFFSEEQAPPTGSTTVINANQSQSQSQQQSIAVDLAMLVAERRGEYKTGTPERNFLDKLGETLKTAKGIKEIIQNILSIASATGVGIEVIKKVLGF